MSQEWKPDNGIYMDAKYNLVYPEGATHLDGIPEDVLEFIHPHWGNFPPQHPLVVHIVSIAFFFLWVINFFGNGCVIYAFLKVRARSLGLYPPDQHPEDAEQHLRGEPGLIGPHHDDDPGPAGHPQLLPAALLDVGQAVVRYLRVRGRRHGHLLHPQHGRHRLRQVCSSILHPPTSPFRYNVIVKGFSGTKITRGIAFILIVVLWTYSALVCMPPFLGWGYYAPEGLLVTCSYDYLRQDWNAVTFMYYAFAFNFFTPLIIVTFFYVQVEFNLIHFPCADCESGGCPRERHEGTGEEDERGLPEEQPEGRRGELRGEDRQGGHHQRDAVGVHLDPLRRHHDDRGLRGPDAGDPPGGPAPLLPR